MNRLRVASSCLPLAFAGFACMTPSRGAANHQYPNAAAMDRFAGNVAPTQVGDRWIFTYGPMVVEIDAAIGAHIATFSRGGSNVLAAGSWFRPSPQQAWGWPPPAEVESLPFAASVSGQVLTMQGANNKQWGLQAKKRFWANSNSEVFTIEYTLTNTGNSTANWAPWEISRVHPTGLTFFPAGQAIQAKTRSRQLPLQQAHGISWFDYEASALEPGKYIVARDGAEGWIAHVEAGLAFIKTFPDVPVAQIADDEGEIQLYTEAPAGADKFLEVEAEAAVQALAPGQSSVWTVHWYLRQLPDGVVPVSGSTGLVDFVRRQI